MPTPNPGTIWQENDPRLERFVKVVGGAGDRVRIIRVNKDGSPNYILATTRRGD